MSKALSIVLAVAVAFGLLPIDVAEADAAAPDVITLLPDGDAKSGISPAGKAEHYVGKKLFDYMNGGAELFLAYGFEDIGVRSYKKGAVALTVALYRMGSPFDAYGIYAFSAKGKVEDIGGPASLNRNMLSFSKGRYYGRVISQKVSPEASAALVALGKQFYGKLPGKSEVPTEIAKLPQGAVAGSLRYLTNSETAKTVWFDGEGDVLLKGKTRAVTAIYAAGDSDLQVTRATFASAKDAGLMCKALAEKLALKSQTDGQTCSAAGKTPDDSFAAFEVKGDLLRWVGGSEDEKTARQWLGKIK